MEAFYNTKKKFFSDSYCISEEKYTFRSEELILQMLDRIEKLENILGIKNVEPKDVNEFGASVENNPIPAITVSPSNYKKIQEMNIGGEVNIFCMDGENTGFVLEKKGFILKDGDELLDKLKTGFKKVDIDSKKVDIRSKKSQKNKKRKMNRKGNKMRNRISTQKNSFRDPDENIGKREREAAIAKGLIIPAESPAHKEWRSKAGMNRSYE